MEGQKKNYRYVNIKNGLSANYLCNNLTKSDNFVALAKNSFTKNKIIIYKLKELENESLPGDAISHETIEWDHKVQECVHINYVLINESWYLVVGYLGYLDIYNEDGSRRYYSGNSSNFGQQAFDQMNGVFLSSCVGYNIREEDKKVEEYLIVGTSLGEIYKFSITKNNSVIQENKYKYIED